MKRVVWKYPLEDPESLTVRMPANARIVAVAMQHDRPTLWAEVTLDVDILPLVERRFQVVATGQRFEPAALDMDGRALYVGSAVSNELVWHVYEVPG